MSRIYDIIIVGGGLIGRAVAAALLKSPQGAKLKVALVDAAASTPVFSTQTHDSKVVALSNRSKGFLQQIGVWEGISAIRVCPYYAMDVWDGEGTGQVRFSADDVHADQLGHIVENALIVQQLDQLISSMPNIDIYQGSKVVSYTQYDEQKGWASICLEPDSVLRTKLIVGVDGAHSAIRTLAEFKTRNWSYGHTAIVGTLKTALPHQNTAWQRFTSSGPIAFLPLGDDGFTSSLVWSIENDKADVLMSLSDTVFCEQLGRAFEYKLGDVLSIDKRFAIALAQSHAVNYQQQGVVLVGDAAHTIHPLAGLGANIGLADASVFVQEITRALSRNIPFNDQSILRRYERRRQGENLAVMTAMEGFKRLFGSDHLAVRFARNTGLKWFDKNGVIKNRLTKWMCE